jgi:hypothetical protein
MHKFFIALAVLSGLGGCAAAVYAAAAPAFAEEAKKCSPDC